MMKRNPASWRERTKSCRRSSRRKRSEYQSWETSCQSGRPCAPGSGPPPIRTTALHLFPLHRTIPNLFSRLQDTHCLPPTTTPSPTLPPYTSLMARSIATTAILDACSSSTSESGMMEGLGWNESTTRVKGEKKWSSISRPLFICLLSLFPTLAVIQGRLCTGGMTVYWLRHWVCHHIWKPHKPWTIPTLKWVTLSWFWLGGLCKRMTCSKHPHRNISFLDKENNIVATLTKNIVATFFYWVIYESILPTINYMLFKSNWNLKPN